MKKIGMYIGLIACLLMLAVPATAIEQNRTQPACSGYGCGDSSYAPYGYYNGTGAMGYDWSRYPGSTEYCSRWIPAHWTGVRVMMPGRWVNRPVWMPGYPMTQYKKVEGFWQTTGYHTRPDVTRWSSSMTNGGYGMQYPMNRTTGTGYFDQTGMWVPQR